MVHHSETPTRDISHQALPAKMMDGHPHFKNSRMSKIEKYWFAIDHKASNEPLNYKDINLPLARIKRLMKVEENVKMVASEVPILFSKATENFIEELTLRSWINTDESKRRILQRSDVIAAIRTSDVYDFLIYIVPKSALGNSLGKMGKIDMLDTSKHINPPKLDILSSIHDEMMRDNQGFVNAQEEDRKI